MVRRVCVLLFVLAAFFQPAPLLAQAGTGALAGIVLDPDRKAVVSAELVIRNEASGEMRTKATDGSGRFSVAGISTG